ESPYPHPYPHADRATIASNAHRAKRLDSLALGGAVCTPVKPAAAQSAQSNSSSRCKQLKVVSTRPAGAHGAALLLTIVRIGALHADRPNTLWYRTSCVSTWQDFATSLSPSTHMPSGSSTGKHPLRPHRPRLDANSRLAVAFGPCPETEVGRFC